MMGVLEEALGAAHHHQLKVLTEKKLMTIFSVWHWTHDG